MAGILLLGAIFRNSGANCASLPMSIGMHVIGQPQLLERDGNLAAVRRLPRCRDRSRRCLSLSCPGSSPGHDRKMLMELRSPLALDLQRAHKARVAALAEVAEGDHVIGVRRGCRYPCRVRPPACRRPRGRARPPASPREAPDHVRRHVPFDHVAPDFGGVAGCEPLRRAEAPLHRGRSSVSVDAHRRIAARMCAIQPPQQIADPGPCSHGSTAPAPLHAPQRRTGQHGDPDRRLASA